MIHPSISRKVCFIAACAVSLILAGGVSDASAQRSPNYDGNYDKPRGGDDGGGGGGGGVGLFLRFAPAIIEGLNNQNERRRQYEEEYEEDYDDPPPRNTRRRPERRSKPKPRRRITVIPPIPPAPPSRAFYPPPLSTPPTPPRRQVATSEQPQFRPGEIVVIVRDTPQPDIVANQIAENFNLVLLETLNYSLLEATSVYRFGIPDTRPVATVLASVQGVPGVDEVGPNGLYFLQDDAAGSATGLQYALPKMRVPAAQAMAIGRGMSVAVIDSGVDADHPALKDSDLTLIDVVENGVKGPDMHGTAIAGIIAASGDLKGIAPGVKLIAVRAFAPERLGTPPVTSATTLARAVDEAFNAGARIFNMSFAGRREPLLIEIIDAASDRGAVFVAAAGNEGPEAPPAYPAAHEKVIAITATDEKDQLYGKANQGGYVFAAAPGVNILAPVTGEGFDFLSGTSFAAAHVTGVIALLMERNSALTADRVRSALMGAAHDLGPEGLDVGFGAGLTDAYGALLKVSEK